MANDNAGQIKTIVGEIAAMEYAGDIHAIAAVVIDKDGDVRTLFAFSTGTKLPALAGTVLLQETVKSVCEQFIKKRD